MNEISIAISPTPRQGEHCERKAEIMYEPEDEEKFIEILSLDTTWLLQA